MEKKKDPAAKIEEFVIVFKDGALDKLKELARFLDISENNLSDVLVKGIHILDLAKHEGKTEIVIEQKKGKINIDLKKL